MPLLYNGYDLRPLFTKEEVLGNIRRLAPLVVALLLCGAVPASAAPRLWDTASLGDSYISGQGGTETGPYLPGSDTPSNQCHRSRTSPPAILAEWRLISLTDLSCSGATTDDLLERSRFGEPPQISRLRSDARVVYVMVGGNDIGFSEVLGCFVQLNCDTTSVPLDALDRVDQLEPKLNKTYEAIRKQAPKAHVVVQLYPWLLVPNNTKPSGCTWLNQDEQRWGNLIQKKLNELILKRAQAYGFRVADTAIYTARQSLCGADPWYYPIGHPGAAHPDQRGRKAMATEFAKQTR